MKRITTYYEVSAKIEGEREMKNRPILPDYIVFSAEWATRCSVKDNLIHNYCTERRNNDGSK